MKSKLFTYLLLIGFLVSGRVSAQGIAWMNTTYDVPPSPPGMVGLDINASTIDNQGFSYAAYNSFNTANINGSLHPGISGENNIFLVKYDPDGSVVWVKTIEAEYASGYVYNLRTDDQGNLYALIQFSDNLMLDGVAVPSGGLSDYLVAKWDTNANLNWIKVGGFQGQKYPRGIGISVSGDVYVTGYFLGNSLFGNISLAPGNTAYGSFLVKYSETGDMKWARSSTGVGSTSVFVAHHLQIGTRNDVYMLAQFANTVSWGSVTITDPTPGFSPHEVVWVKLDTAGNFLNHVVLPANTSSSGANGQPKLAVDADGYSYIASHYDGSATVAGVTLNCSGPSCPYVLKLDPNGVAQWAQNISDVSAPNSSAIIRSLDIDEMGNFYVAGVYRGTPIIGNLQLPADTTESFVASFQTAAGTFNWAIGAETEQASNIQQVSANASGQVLYAGTYMGIDMALGNLQSPMQGFPTTSQSFVARILNDFNSVSGSVFIDANTNGIQDTLEVGHPDGYVISVSPGQYAFHSDAQGNFAAVTGIGNYTVALANPPLYHNVVAAAAPSVSFTAYGNNLQGHDYALQPIPNQQDLRINVTNLQPPRPGFPTTYRITYRNIGTTTIPAGNVTLTLDPLFTFLSSSQPGTQTGNTLTWSFANLLPGQVQNLDVLVSLTAVAPLGNLVTCTASITPTTGDLTPANNTESSIRTIVGSFDPNSIEVNYEQLTLQQLQNGQKLNYTIRFQNMGTDTAFTVMLRDSIPAFLLNLGTIELVSSSHSCTYTLNAQGILTVLFTNIRLPHQGINSIGSNGFVRFQIKPFQNLAIGDVIPNEAHIYFDYNAPITTNTAETEVVQISAAAGQLSPEVLQLFPNPAGQSVRVRAISGRSAAVKLRLVNSLGQQVFSHDYATSAPQFEQEINLQKLPSGVYSVQLQTETGTVVKQLVKQ